MSLPFTTTTKPVSVWNKPLEADWKGLFTSLAKGIGHTASGKWEELAADAVGVVTSIGLKTTVEERAWLLIRNAIIAATFELVSAHRRHLPEKDEDVQFTSKAEELFEQADVEISTRFFQHPGELSIITTLADLLRQWLIAQKLSEPNARNISSRLPEYFTYALIAEWRKHPSVYEPLLKAIETPFAEAGEKEFGWQQYRARLERQVHEPMFDEAFSLAQVFVPLLGSYEQRKDGKRTKDGRARRSTARVSTDMRAPDDEREVHQHVIDLSEHFMAWLEAAERGDAIRVIRGGPGSGKSSFARMFAAELAHRNGPRVVYIPLHDLDLKDTLANAIDDFASRTGLLPEGLLDAREAESRLVLVLDGLDELEMRGRVGTETARDFISEVEKAVRTLNNDHCRLQVLITGRDLAVQQTETEFRKEGQIVNVLPYSVQQDSDKRSETEPHNHEKWHDPENLLENDRRDTWWSKYASVTGRSEKGLPTELKRDDLYEITVQPLLCYLVALSFTAGTIDFAQEDVDLNQIYEDLLVRVYERGYDSGPHRSVSKLTREEFIEILEQVGLAAWHGSARGGGRRASLAAIRDTCERNPRLRKLVEQFKEDAEAGLMGLLAGFYFRQHGKTEAGDAVIEFTHKSFGEFLAARRIARAAQRVAKKIREGEAGDEDGWTERKALQVWAEYCGPAAIDWDLLPFLRGEVKHRGKLYAEDCQAVFSKLFSRMLREGMPMHELGLESYRRMREQAINAETSLMIFLNACCRTSQTVARIDWPNITAFGTWLLTVRGQRKDSTNHPILHSLSWIDYSNCILYVIDLFGADLSHSRLTVLELSVLNGANLFGADLLGANLRWADLRGANLREANLRGADLQRANLDHADFREADLRGAKLQGADLRDADLRYAKLEGAKLEGAKRNDEEQHEPEVVVTRQPTRGSSRRSR